MAHPEILAILRAFGLTNQKMNFEEFQRFFENLCKREFQKSDLDVNGFLSQDEVTAMLARATSSLPEDLADAFTSKVFISMIFNEVDANKDGKLQLSEMAKWVKIICSLRQRFIVKMNKWKVSETRKISIIK